MSTLTPTEVAQIARRLYTEGPGFARLSQRWRPFICPFHMLVEKVPTRAAVLDIGCGSGLFLTLLASTNRISKGVGFDANAATVAMAVKATEHLKASQILTFRHASVEEPWPEGGFDVVSMIDVLHHIPPDAHESVIEQAAARVRPGGMFLYKDIARRPHWKAWANRLHDLVVAPARPPGVQAATASEAGGAPQPKQARCSAGFGGRRSHRQRVTSLSA
jgi:2-polyprenyl-3-methyl-5-hydroxy-6-metoxy-1,4-benzoquinol methylase